ncbi:MAG TPA: FixH family protein [Burkholderiaceae bacterium]|nr:FixH family protein [Burkholderiaceae bacterium]
MTHDLSPPTAWYRQPYLWLVIGGPSLVIVASFFTWWIAATSADSLVMDDYYREGKAINLSIRRDVQASALGLKSNVTIDANNHVAVELTANAALQWPDTIELVFVHPTRASGDKRAVLRRAASSNTARYEGMVSDVEPVHYGVVLQDLGQVWRLTGVYNGGTEHTIQLVASIKGNTP